MTTRFLGSPAARVWLVLVLLTSTSFALAERAPSAGLAATAVVLIAALKVRLVFVHFMELRWRPLPWRLVFELWTLAAAAIIVCGYWLAVA
jgi:heme/copper-type cytochrome/quinol oxidase subunit 4